MSYRVKSAKNFKGFNDFIKNGMIPCVVAL